MAKADGGGIRTTVPGIKAIHAIITPNCRTVPRGSDPVMDAFEEAVSRVREEYRAVAGLRGDAWSGHLVFTVEPPARTEEPEAPEGGEG